MTNTIAPADTSDREILISRTFQAPPEKVWEAWTDPRHLGAWWGPNGFTTTTHEWDFRPGGRWRHTMHGPDGTDFPNLCIYKEIVPPKLLTYSHSGGQDDGNGGHSDDATFHVTVTFEPVGSKTLLTMRSVFSTKAARDHVVEHYGALEGGHQTLARLDKYISEETSPLTKG